MSGRKVLIKLLQCLLLLWTSLCFSEPEFITFPSDVDWTTRRSAHFTALYRKGNDRLAERSLIAAEKARKQLVPFFPEAPEHTWMVVADWTDTLNGYSVNVPWSHFVIFVAPPLVSSELATLDGWLESVILHEYVHTLHAYPASGLWSPLRFVFGSWVLPNLLMPGHLIEGIATYYETALTRGGRGRGAIFNMYKRMAVANNQWGKDFVPLDKLEGTATEWPHGASRYFFGYYLHENLVKRKGRKGLYRLTESFSSNWPYLIHTPFNEVYGEDLDTLWEDTFRETTASTQKEIQDIKKTPLSKLNYLTQNAYFKRDTALSPNGRYVAYRSATPYDRLHIAIFDLKRKKVRKTFETSGGGTGMCWGPKQRYLLYLEGDSSDGYFIHNLKRYDLKNDTEILLNVEKNPLSHAHALSCNSQLDTVFIFREVGGEGEALEVKGDFTADRPNLRVSRSWKMPDGYWASSILEGSPTLLAVRKDHQTHFYNWNKEGPKKLYTVDGHVFGLRASKNAGEFHGIWDKDGRYEVWTFQKSQPSARKRVALLGGANAFEEIGNQWLVSSYEQGGWDLALASDRTQTSQRIANPSPTSRSTAAISISSPQEYSAWSTIFPRMWIPSLLVVPDGIQFSAFVPGFDISQTHNYSLFLGYDQRFPSGSSAKASGFASLGYTYRFGRSTSALFSSFFSPSYIISTQTYQTRWGTSIGIGGTPFDPEFPYTSLTAEFSRLEAFTLSSSRQPSQQSVGFGISMSKNLAEFKSDPLGIAPYWGTRASLQYSYYFKALSSSDDYFSSTVGLDQYLPAPWWSKSSFYLKARLGYTEGTSRFNSFYQGGGELLFSAGRSLFQNRGYPAGFFFARRIFSLSGEYLFPLGRVDRGVGLLPAFLSEFSGGLVADLTTSDLGPLDSIRPLRFFQRYFGSVGFEFKSSWRFGYYLPATIRLGIYHPWKPTRFNLPPLRFVFSLTASLL